MAASAPTPEPSPKTDKTFSPWQLLIHISTNTFVFAVIALLAVGLSLGVDYLAARGVNSFILYGLRIAEYLLFAVDLLLFVVFIVRTAWRTLKEMWKP